MWTPGIVLTCLAGYGLLGGLFLGLAGQLDPLDRATLAVSAVSHLVATLLCVHDKELIRERLRPGPGAPRWDLVLVWAIHGALLANLLVVPLDIGRFHWTAELPQAWRVVGIVGSPIGMLLTAWAMRANTFFSKVVRLQEDRGHQLIQGGPYRLVRHPGYAGILLFFTGFNLGFGCWSAVGCSALLVLLLTYRIVREERFLHQHLDGYGDYARRVRWRLLPGIW